MNSLFQAIVPSVCDWCIFFACGPRPGYPRVFRTHPFHRHSLEGLGSLDSPAIQSRLGVVGAALSRITLRTRDSVFGVQSDAEHIEPGQMDLLIPTEVMSIPVARGQLVLGVLALARSDGRPPFDEAETDFAANACSVVAQWLATTRRELLPAEFH